jgi:PH (Pleckstrin Homology) domain-containing protein/putative oligomerization/nucleic acid binding protein
MTRYADTLLSDGEEVVLRTRQHPLATIIEARWPWLLFIGSLVVLFFFSGMNDGQLRTILGYIALGGIVISLLWLGKIYWSWLSQDYLITNRRVVKVEGIINKRSADSSLEKINDAVLSQDLWGRMFNYGDLDILTAADVAIDQYRMLNAAPRFKREMLNQKHDLEGDYNRPMPGPPLRGGVAMPPPAAAAPPPREMSADEVTRALAGLADLRDRGAISPEEFEAKKAQLLARL